MELSWSHWRTRRRRSCGGIIFALQFATLLGVADAQARNFIFEDQDADTGQIGGTMHWAKPAAGDAGDDYAVYLAQDANGASQTQVGAPFIMTGGADIYDYTMPYDTAIGSNSHILLYMKSIA